MAGKNNIVLERDGVKRSISFPFAMCADRETLTILRDIISNHLGRDDNWSYGWITIHEPVYIRQTSNTPPSEWTD